LGLAKKIWALALSSFRQKWSNNFQANPPAIMAEQELLRSTEIDYQVDDTIQKIQNWYIKRYPSRSDPSDSYLFYNPCYPTSEEKTAERLQDIRKQYDRLLIIMRSDYSIEKLPVNKKEIKKQMDILEEAKRDHLFLTEKWEKLRLFSIRNTYGDVSEYNEKIDRKFRPLFLQIYELEQKYCKYDYGIGLDELERMRKRLGVGELVERKDMQAHLEEAKREEGCEEVTKKNEERNQVR